jgi:hypothetical protein
MSAFSSSPRLEVLDFARGRLPDGPLLSQATARGQDGESEGFERRPVSCGGRGANFFCAASSRFPLQF